MSGELAFAGKLLTPVAAKATKRLARRLGFDRWKIARRVHELTGITFPKPEFRGWLKSLRQQDFLEPVETAAPRLAIALDEALATAGQDWLRKPGRTSAALLLVQATYASLLETLGQGQADALRDEWAKSRNETLLTQLSELTLDRGGWGRLDGADLYVYLARRSWERRAIRLEAVGISADLRSAIIQILNPDLPVVPAGTTRVLVGPFGAGKTEVAEAWHMATVSELLTHADAPIPVWLYARDLSSANVERAIAAAMGSDELLLSRGAAVVIDGVDEVDGLSADAIARDARVFVAGSPRSRVLLTSRPHVLPTTDDDLLPPTVSGEQLIQLVEALGGRGVIVHSWPPALKESTSRPFFALAAATSAAADRHLNGQAGLMRNLVELAMSRGSAQTIVSGRALFEELVDLAVNLTTREGPASFDFATTQRLLATRLVSKTPSGHLQFSLPIFEQWFAAQRLITNDEAVSHAFSSRQAFDRWRWAAAVALSGAESQRADLLMTAVLELNAGAAGWLLKQVSSGFRPDRLQTETDFTTVSSRKMKATRSWVNSLGPLAPLCFPIQSSSAGIRLGLRISRSGWQEWAWSTDLAETDEVVPLPDTVTTFGAPVDGWTGIHGEVATAGPMWPWLSVQRAIAQQTLKVLESEDLLGGQDGVWSDELMYHFCRILTDNKTIAHAPMARDGLKIKVEEILALASEPETTLFLLSKKSITGANLMRLQAWLNATSEEFVLRPAPEPDLDISQSSGWVWGVYSDRRLLTLATEIYGNACQAYDEVVANTFPTLDWALGRQAYAPMGLIGVATRGTDGTWADGPLVSYIEVPLEMVQTVSTQSGYEVSRNGRAAFKWVSRDELAAFGARDLQVRLLQAWSAKSPRTTGPFGSIHSSVSRFDTADDRPSSELAAKWIFSDLKSIALGNGTFPNLDR